MTARIRHRRDELSITGPVLAKALGFTTTYWSKVENEQRILQEEKFRKLLDFLEIPADEREELLELREVSTRSGWWSAYSKIFNAEHLRLCGLEYGAEEVRAYESLLIPGLLQTEEYARSLIKADQIAIPGKEVERRVSTRMRRQERVFGADPLRLVAVVSQAALEQQFGGAAVLYRQLQHLAAAIKEHPDTIDFRVIPFTSTVGPIIGGTTFYLLDFPSPRLGSLAWYETPVISQVIENPEKVFDLSQCFQHAQLQALSQAESLALIDETAGRLGSIRTTKD
ncbi:MULTISPECIES: Scr1 family TA system antitoxin-like transcriptional regulator [unclassified Nocardia]|uniref:helix-turn-helix domain-containing protein n=1 Tax=unclassified Nocardia TaxID=2637762 RepID=UPI001CE406F3|nr:MULTISPECIES: Scr1 family TA system antitoxin-like transcriptional regulator [unclassified Nocardia]